MRYVGFVLLGFCLLLVNFDVLNSQERRRPQLRPAQKQPGKKDKADERQQKEKELLKEKAFLKEVEVRAKKEGHYAKVEAKGVLRYKQRTPPPPPPRWGPQFRRFDPPEWFLHSGGVQGTTFGLNFPETSDLEKLAKQLEGKTVLVTGQLGVYVYGPYEFGSASAGIAVATLKEAP